MASAQDLINNSDNNNAQELIDNSQSNSERREFRRRRFANINRRNRFANINRRNSRRIGTAIRALSNRRGLVRGVSEALYKRTGQIQPPTQMSQFDKRYKQRQTFRGASNGRKGRPFGTVKYRDSSGNPIGVYEYRKLLSAKLRNERMQILQRSAISPSQQVALRQIQQREAYRRSNPEGQVIPNTDGGVFMEDIMGDISKAAGLID